MPKPIKVPSQDPTLKVVNIRDAMENKGRVRRAMGVGKKPKVQTTGKEELILKIQRPQLGSHPDKMGLYLIYNEDRRFLAEVPRQEAIEKLFRPYAGKIYVLAVFDHDTRTMDIKHTVGEDRLW